MKLAASSGFGCRSLYAVLFLLVTIQFAAGQSNVQGKWTTLSYTTPINPIHAALLSNGKILIVAGSGSCPPYYSFCPQSPPFGPHNESGAELLDPVAGTITQYTVPWDMFCNAMIVLPDGRPFIVGGTESYGPISDPEFTGFSATATYDPATGIFSGQQATARGRWYPTTIVLGNGQVMVLSGAIWGMDNHDQNLNGTTDSTVELYTVGTGWSQEYPVPSTWTPPLYPRLHVLPSGKVFYSAPESSSALFDPSTQTWTLDVANTIYGGSRGYGTSVLLPLTPANNYDPKVMILGGTGLSGSGNPSTDTTEIIDLGASTLEWESGPNMSEPRIEMNATILPNGKVLAIGGSTNDEDTTTPSLNADLYDPVANTMSSAGTNAYAHLYHSTSLLLPDATVWFAGGNPEQGTWEPHMEIYQPAYLFNSNGTLATRPTITSAPASIGYGSQFTVQTPDAASISSVVLMRNGAVTHAFNMDQRMVGLSFAAGSGSLTVTAPSSGNIAPPGYYMLFLLNSAGVPSVSTMIQVPSGIALPPPPSGISFVQVNSATATSGSSIAIPYANGQIAGDLNVVAVMSGDTTSSISSVTDSNDNTYTRAVGPTTTTGLQQSIYYAKNIAGGSNTVTVKFSQTASYPNVNVAEYSGLDTANPLDVTAAASGSGTSASSGSATTTSANELIVGAGNPSGLFTAAGSLFSNRLINIYGGISEDQIVNGAGSYAATATNNGGTWIMQMATFRGSMQSSPSPPDPTSISPTSGPTSGGTPVTISGTNFVSGATVTFGGTAATNVVVVSSTTITATTPAGAAGAVNVVVTNSNGQSGTLTNGYTYTAAPAPTSISPTSGTTSGGTPVTISGTNFVSGATVTFGGTAATNVVVVSSTTITATTPAHAAGAVNVVVTNSNGQSGTLTNGYTYTAAPAPTSISPTSGTTSGGTPVTISGTNFVSGATVTFGGTAATNVVVVSSTTITATTPAHAAGAVDVVVTNSNGQSGTLTNGYTYTAAPAPTSISPTSGTTSGGTPVTISGTNFVSGATVTFGGTAATNVVVVSSTTITATTPAGAAGAVNVVVTNSNGQSGTLTNGYTYTAAPAPTSISPTSGTTSGGTPVTISGTNFVSGATVTFGGTAATNVVVVSSTTITATTPAHAAGAVNVVVTNSNGQSGTLTNGYTYTAAPAPTSISPTSGTTSGGTPVTISGTNFVSGATVTFGGTAATNVVVVSSTTITATTPAHAAGAVNVVVTNSNGQSGTLTNGYTYTAAPAPTSISPTSGTTSGGTPVTISGTNFVSGATVTFGGTAATNVVVVSSTTITATTPAHAAGAVNVVVTNSNGQSGTLTNGYTYTAAPAPTSISPTSGTTSGGTPVTISGTNFVSGATVTFGGTAATNVVVVSSTTITATTPAHAAGAVNVVVTNSNGQSGTLTNGYTYTAAPAPTSISPTSGTTSGGTPVTISGTNFVSGATVTFGGTAATNVVVVSSTTITATTPAHAAGAVNVVVTNSNGQSGTLTNGYTYTSGATIKLVQSATGPTTIQASNTSVAVAYAHAETAGDLNVVAVGCRDATSSIISLTDSQGNTYTRAVGPTTTTGLQQSIYYAKNIIGGSNTVTVTFNQAAAYPDLRILEYSGLDPTSPLDVTAAAAGTGTTASSGSATTTSANELIFGAGDSPQHFTAAGSGFTKIGINIYGNIAESKVVSSSGSNAATATNTGGVWVMQMATFKAKP